MTRKDARIEQVYRGGRRQDSRAAVAGDVELTAGRRAGTGREHERVCVEAPRSLDAEGLQRAAVEAHGHRPQQPGDSGAAGRANEGVLDLTLRFLAPGGRQPLDDSGHNASLGEHPAREQAALAGADNDRLSDG